MLRHAVIGVSGPVIRFLYGATDTVHNLIELDVWSRHDPQVGQKTAIGAVPISVAIGCCSNSKGETLIPANIKLQPLGSAQLTPQVASTPSLAYSARHSEAEYLCAKSVCCANMQQH